YRAQHGARLAAAVRHAPLAIEGLGGDAALAHADRRALVGITQRERGRGGLATRGQQGQQDQRRQRPAHLVAPTTTRLNESGGKNLRATRWTSAAVTLAMLA